MGRPLLTSLTAIAFVVAVVLNAIALLSSPNENLIKTGSVVIPATWFYAFDVLVLVYVAYYMYYLLLEKCDHLIDYMRFPFILSLSCLSAGWMLWRHENFVGAASLFGIGADIALFAVFYYIYTAQKLRKEHEYSRVDDDDELEYKNPTMRFYIAGIGPMSTLAAWLLALFYVALIGALFEKENISTTVGAANILIALLAVVVFPLSIFYHSFHLNLVLFWSLVAIATTLEADVLVRVVWTGVGLMAGLFVWSLHGRFVFETAGYINYEQG